MLRTNSMPQITARLFFSLPGKSTERTDGRTDGAAAAEGGATRSKDEFGRVAS